MNSSVTVERLVAALPEPSGGWERHVGGGAVQYRVPGEHGVRAAAKVTVRPDRLGEAAVRVDRITGCRTAGTTRHEAVDEAVAAVETALDRAAAGDA